MPGIKAHPDPLGPRRHREPPTPAAPEQPETLLSGGHPPDGKSRTAPNGAPPPIDDTALASEHPGPGPAPEHPTAATEAGHRWTGRAMAVLRLALGWLFLWAFLDKLFGLGHPTPAGAGWFDGTSPTTGYLGHVDGPLASVFQALSGAPAADALFMGGLAGLGLALLLGVGLRVAAAGSVLLLGSLWASSLPLENNPFLDQHLIYLAAVIALAAARAGDTWGLGRYVRGVALLR